MTSFKISNFYWIIPVKNNLVSVWSKIPFLFIFCVFVLVEHQYLHFKWIGEINTQNIINKLYRFYVTLLLKNCTFMS